MENNLPPQQPTPNPMPQPEAQPAPAVEGPTIVSPGTNTPIQPVAPQIPIQHGSGKSKGLIIVAVVLVLLISVLGIIYYMIIKQSTSSPKPVVVTEPVVTPTVPPTATPTPSPTDEQILNDTSVSDPSVDVTPLTQDASGL